MVTGDHPYADAGIAALGDRLAGLRPRRVDDADECDEDDPVEQILRVVDRVELGGGEVLGTDSEHPHAVAGQLVVVAGVAAVGVVVELEDVGPAEVAVGPGGEHVGGTLDEAADHPAVVTVVPTVEGGHELVVGVERHLPHAGLVAAQRNRVDATLLGEDEQGTLGGITDHLVVA